MAGDARRFSADVRRLAREITKPLRSVLSKDLRQTSRPSLVQMITARGLAQRIWGQKPQAVNKYVKASARFSLSQGQIISTLAITGLPGLALVGGRTAGHVIRRAFGRGPVRHPGGAVAAMGGRASVGAELNRHEQRIRPQLDSAIVDLARQVIR